ncbi:nucleotidyltransferase domain-containing protein [Agromyces intestinalis]|uniref:Nucleotidyltransferase domain-containing protein n=1 Tax=Agromyces intestinalis TaxID=2592652 RepID=A0A5C1YFM3_9MICO|nr:nucleotidyltransferase domain-containing protein [Agromyces intestinalis]QEO13807.1 nucleotidyltransferase domain-containing protein [Agromyces intestinalis]
MQLQHPLGAISGGVEGDVLAALTRAGDAQMDVAQLARLTGKSYTGVKLSLRRLVSQGTVLESHVGAKSLYRFNADHILAPAIGEIVSAKSRFLERVATQIRTDFTYAPMFAALFGSASRDDMTPESDIDLFLVRPDDADAAEFDDEASELALAITRLTGNDARMLVYGLDEIAEGPEAHPVLAEIARDGVMLAGTLDEFRKAIRGASTPA